MDHEFAQTLAEWAAFYTLMGGAAATLLGLLFVAVSLRLNIFHQREIADVREFATFTLGTFLVAIAVAGLALAPHARRITLALPLLVIGALGLVFVAVIARLWLRLNRPSVMTEPEIAHFELRGISYMLIMAVPYVGLMAVALLLLAEHPAALGWLAVVEAGLLVLGTAAAWLLLSHAGGKVETDTDAG